MSNASEVSARRFCGRRRASTTSDILGCYERARATSDATIEALDLDTIGTDWPGPPVTLRWAVDHMLEEVARHAGHVDLARELIDGRMGDYPDA